jgi:hypothetical protein
MPGHPGAGDKAAIEGFRRGSQVASGREALAGRPLLADYAEQDSGILQWVVLMLVWADGDAPGCVALLNPTLLVGRRV